MQRPTSCLPTLGLVLCCALPAAAQQYFYERFENNNAGWTLGPEWEIGPATASPRGTFGCAFPDPGSDADGIAGGALPGS